MENPNLTFVTPTLVAGDRSLADVVIHEISHSWTGNLVTNYNWESFFLNEGGTMFLQRKIMGRLYGRDVAQTHALGGYLSLENAVAVFKQQGKMHLTALVPKLDGVDPDDAFSRVPYEKGACCPPACCAVGGFTLALTCCACVCVSVLMCVDVCLCVVVGCGGVSATRFQPVLLPGAERCPRRICVRGVFQAVPCPLRPPIHHLLPIPALLPGVFLPRRHAPAAAVVT